MKKTIFIILLSLLYFHSKAQSNDMDYALLNEVIPSLLDLKKNDTLAIYKKLLDFPERKKLFIKENFLEYKHVVIGDKNKKKIIKIACKLDFKFLSEGQNESHENWDLSKLHYPFMIFSENNDVQNKVKRCAISKPFYSEDRKIAFIYYSQVCNYDNCGASTLKIYKKKKGKWILFVNLPIYLS